MVRGLGPDLLGLGRGSQLIIVFLGTDDHSCLLTLDIVSLNDLGLQFLARKSAFTNQSFFLLVVWSVNSNCGGSGQLVYRWRSLNALDKLRLLFGLFRNDMGRNVDSNGLARLLLSFGNN